MFVGPFTVAWEVGERSDAADRVASVACSVVRAELQHRRLKTIVVRRVAEGAGVSTLFTTTWLIWLHFADRVAGSADSVRRAELQHCGLEAVGVTRGADGAGVATCLSAA